MVSSPWFAVNVAVASLMVPQNNEWRVLRADTEIGNIAEVYGKAVALLGKQFLLIHSESEYLPAPLLARHNCLPRSDLGSFSCFSAY